MARNILEPGEYVITSPISQFVLDIWEGEAVACPFTLSSSQKWNLQKASGGRFWTLQNTQSSMYLGMMANDTVRDHYRLQEVDYPFPWRLDFAYEYTRLAVPYSSHFLDFGQARGLPEPGADVHLYENGALENQKWIFSKPPVHTLENDKIYLLRHIRFEKMVQLTEKHEGYASETEPPGNSHHFRAISMGGCWALKHVQSDKFLGLPPVSFCLSESTRLRGVDFQFPWLVVPSWSIEEGFGSSYRIYVPFTKKMIKMSQSTGEVTVHTETSRANWEFREVHTMALREPTGPIVGEPLEEE